MKEINIRIRLFQKWILISGNFFIGGSPLGLPPSLRQNIFGNIDIFSCIRYNKHDYLNYKYNKKENYSENTIK